MKKNSDVTGIAIEAKSQLTRLQVQLEVTEKRFKIAQEKCDAIVSNELQVSHK